jgi:hypothetical protein
MADDAMDLLTAFELHDTTAIAKCLATNHVHALIKGKPPLEHLLEMYTRSDRFPACVRVLLDAGAVLADKALRAVLLNDATALKAELAENSEVVRQRVTLTSTFTPLVGATLLHVACEYGHLQVAEALVDAGALVNARTLETNRALGHSPLFHTVNSNDNRSRPLMDLLLARGADPLVRLPILTWGRGFEWETTFFDITPMSYCQFGLLPQMHRDEVQIYDNLKVLCTAAGRVAPALANVPNAYVRRA